jgi:hypothetical protein
MSGLRLTDMPAFLLPRKGRYGLCDYEKMFCANLKGGHDIFDMRGIDRQQGCMVVLRPDQYVAHVLPIDAYAELAGYFDAFMVRDVSGGDSVTFEPGQGCRADRA